MYISTLLCPSVVTEDHAEEEQEHFDHLEWGSDGPLASGDYLEFI